MKVPCHQHEVSYGEEVCPKCLANLRNAAFAVVAYYKMDAARLGLKRTNREINELELALAVDHGNEVQ